MCCLRVLEQRALLQSENTCNNTRTAVNIKQWDKAEHSGHKNKSFGTKPDKFGRRTNQVRSHDCVQNVTAGRNAWTLLITERKKKHRETDENAESGNKHTRCTHLASAHLPTMTAVLSFPCPWDVTNKLIL